MDTLKSLSASQNNKVKPVSIHRYLYYYIIIIICKFLSNDHLHWVLFWYEKHSANFIFLYLSLRLYALYHAVYLYVYTQFKNHTFLLRCCWFKATLYTRIPCIKSTSFKLGSRWFSMICLHKHVQVWCGFRSRFFTIVCINYNVPSMVKEK